MSVRIHCQVLEAPTPEWSSLTRSGRGGQSHREILPWADPYIAQLMQRLESRFDAEERFAEERNAEESNAEESNQRDATGAADDSPWPGRQWSGDWDGDSDLDAEFSSLETSDGLTNHALPAVHGGWPLLNDVPGDGMRESYDGDSF